MTTNTRLAIIAVAVFGLIAVQAQGTESSDLLQEIRNLRTDILEARVERKADTVILLEQILSGIRADLARLQDEERAAAEQIAQLEAHLTTSKATPEERLHIEEARAVITGGQVENARTRRAVELRAREAEIAGRLSRAQHALHELQVKRPNPINQMRTEGGPK